MFNPAFDSGETMSLLQNRIFLAGSFIVLLALASAPIFFDFHPSSKISPSALGMGVILGIIVALPFLIADHRINGAGRHRSESLKQIFRVCVIFPLIGTGLVTFTGPFVHTLIFGQQRVITGVVIEKSSGSGKRRSCDYYVYVRIAGITPKSKQCLPQEAWRKTQVGGLLELRISSGDYGYLTLNVKTAI